LQASVHAQADFCGLHPEEAGRLGLPDGATVLVSQGGEAVRLPLRVDARVPVGAAWVRAATEAVACLGPAMGPIDVAAAGEGR
jgi:anaerobic selenocysteine-containing dehydrogenase